MNIHMEILCSFRPSRIRTMSRRCLAKSTKGHRLNPSSMKLQLMSLSLKWNLSPKHRRQRRKKDLTECIHKNRRTSNRIGIRQISRRRQSRSSRCSRRRRWRVNRWCRIQYFERSCRTVDIGHWSGTRQLLPKAQKTCIDQGSTPTNQNTVTKDQEQLQANRTTGR